MGSTLRRVSLLKEVLQLCRIRLDEALQPHGITTSQLRMLWMLAENPGVSGAQVARLCAVTPQTGQESLRKMESHGWIRRRASEGSERVLVSELTVSGRATLEKAREIAKSLDATMWAGVSAADLAGLERALEAALGRLSRP
jgi:DNA-binding MarR family transcriptional regulator